jgi:putative N6-adenine-specific DNA methylase
MSARALVATCSRGLEDVLADEVASLGAADVSAGRGVVRFRGDRRLLAAACVGLRTAVRVLVPAAASTVAGRDDLYDLARGYPWEDVLPPGGTLAVTVAGRSTALSNSHFAAQVVKDAVVDRVRDRRRERPAVDLARPHLPIHLHLRGERASLALDAVGAPLSKRGYRPHGGPAPLNEALAAGLLLLAGYDGSRPLLDPMGGSGTFAAEAALIASRSAPGRLRRFAFERWLGHDAALLENVRRELDAARVPPPQPILTRDADAGAVRAARRNLAAAGVAEWVEIEHGDATSIRTPAPGSLIVVNPPYGKRLGSAGALGGLYRGLGDRLKEVAAGCTAWILVGNRELAKRIGLQASRRLVVFNGPIECRWMRYDLYEGSRRTRASSDRA